MEFKMIKITASGITKNYGKTEVLNGVDAEFVLGKIYAVAGSNGCGKSTLLNIIGSIDSATSGIVRSGGRDITALDENAQADYRSHFLGFVFQFHYLLKDFTALENVYLPAYMAGVSKKDAISRAERLLEDVGLQDRLHHLPSELSGGERQRAAVARALINDPHLILADEPTGNLDPVNAEIVGNLFFSIAYKYRKTLIMVTHDQNLAAKGSVRYSIAGGKLEAAD